jgi:hypothetical protein
MANRVLVMAAFLLGKDMPFNAAKCIHLQCLGLTIKQFPTIVAGLPELIAGSGTNTSGFLFRLSLSIPNKEEGFMASK